MFWDVFKFELLYHRRQYLVYVLFGVFFLLTFLATATPNVSMVGNTDNLNINASYTILMTLGSVNLLALFGLVAFVANAVLRDFDCRSVELFYSKPVPKKDYVYGRFFGALVYAYIIYLGGVLGLMVGELMPWLDQGRIGAFSLKPYLYATAVLTLPNLFVFSALFFTAATLTRSMMWTYVCVLTLVGMSMVVSSFTEPATVAITSILDPFGTTALDELMRYWTVSERNSELPQLSGAILQNRILWGLLGVFAFLAAYRFFPMSVEPKSRKSKSPEVVENQSTKVFSTLPQVKQRFDWSSHLTQLFYQSRLEVKNVVFSVPFLVVVLVGLSLVLANAAGDLGNIAGTSAYPATLLMVNLINGSFSLSLLVVLIYYSGEILSREHSVKLTEIMDAMPYPNWVMMASKYIALMTVIIIMLFAAMLAGIVIQVSRGFYDISLWQYLAGLFLFFQFPFYFMSVLAITAYVLSRSKYIAMFLMVLYIVICFALPAMGFEHYLYRGRQTFLPSSDFTGFSHNLVPYLWQTLYWTLFGGLLTILVHLLWPRGTEDTFRNRLKLMRARMTQSIVWSIWVCSTAFVLVGAYIYYNTVILNEYISRDDLRAQQADYEKRFKQYQNAPGLVITDVYAELDFYPAEREVTLAGKYTLKNSHSEALSELHLSIPQGVRLQALEIPGAQLREKTDLGIQYHIYDLARAVAPGQSVEVSFETALFTPGFANNGHTVRLTPNGSFIDNTELFPLPGYRRDFELQDNSLRRQNDLPPLQRASAIDDVEAVQRSGFIGERVNFESIVSTTDDQIAIAPGYLQKRWQEAGREYFHYKMDAPIWNFYSFVSANYQVKKDVWQDVDLEVYYHHDYNVDRMIEATKAGLDYFTQNFSPYQYRQFRIMEFPSYQGRFAQSFPNTIPFSESIGFMADLRDPKNIDYVYYVTAHELAHQWWAHQVLGADVQGGTMIVETLAQYSALMVMKAEYGDATMQKFLRFELDGYLQGRGSELIDELPLYLVEDQPYIHYRKGSLVLYALQDMMGEASVNKALARFIKQYAFKGAPYPTSKDLLALIREEAGADHQQLITDLFEKIVLYDVKVADATAVLQTNNSYEVTVEVEAQKYESDGQGQAKPLGIKDWLDIVVLGEEDPSTGVAEVLYQKKHLIDKPLHRFVIKVDKAPKAVGIDPFNKMIDRNPDDNVKEL